MRAVAKREIGTLSGGQRLRLDVALGFSHRPKLLFLDEPPPGSTLITARTCGSTSSGSTASIVEAERAFFAGELGGPTVLAGALAAILTGIIGLGVGVYAIRRSAD